MPHNIYTRCPECSTVFRVTEQHLNIAKGKVRCGACLSIFKATDHLVRPKDDESSAKNEALDSEPNESSPTEPSQETQPAPEQSADTSHSMIDRLAEQHKDHPAEPQGGDPLLKASHEAEMEIHFTKKEHKTSYPIGSYTEDGALEQSGSEEIDSVADTQNEEPGDSHQSGLDDISIDIENEQGEEPGSNDDQEFDPSLDEINDFLIEDDFSDSKEPLPTNDFEANESNESLDYSAHIESPVEQANDAENLDEEITQHFDDILQTPLEDESLEQEPFQDSYEMDDVSQISDESPQLNDVSSSDLLDEFDTLSDSEDDININTLSANLDGETLEPDPLDEFDEIIEQKNHTFKWLGLVIVLLMLLGWGTFTLWSERQTLAYDSTWSGAVNTMCSILDCNIQPRRDIQAIELIQRNVRPNEANPDISEFSLMLRNNAAYDQPYPTVEISFTDTEGNVIATETHTPENYLAEDLLNTAMPVGQKVHILIIAKEPRSQVFGFQFNFL